MSSICERLDARALPASLRRFTCACSGHRAFTAIVMMIIVVVEDHGVAVSPSSSPESVCAERSPTTIAEQHHHDPTSLRTPSNPIRRCSECCYPNERMTASGERAPPAFSFYCVHVAENRRLCFLRLSYHWLSYHWHCQYRHSCSSL